MAGPNRFKVASVTTAWKAPRSVRDITVNASEAIAAVEELNAFRPDLICLPEGFLYAGLAAHRAQDIAIGRDDQLLLRFSDLANSCDAYLAVPVLERSEHGIVYNAVVLFGRNGARVGSYTKRVPWPSDPGMSEFENGVAIGAGGGPFETDGGLVGIQTCFEINWPSGWQALRQAGVKLVLFPSEQPGGKILGYRAWDAGSYVLSAVSKGGPSQLRDPLGNVVASWSARTKGPVATLSLDYELVHLDHNEAKLRSLAGRLRGRARFTPFPAERVCLVTSLAPQLRVESLLAENGIPNLDEYLQRAGARRQGFVPVTAAGNDRVESATAEAPIRSISVVVPTTGHSPMLEHCLHALQSQAVGVTFDIVLVVNGDGCDSFQCPVPGISVVRETGIGPAAARNRGVTESKGDCIAFIDDDCMPSPQWLAAAIKTLENSKRDVIVAGAISRSGTEKNAISIFDSVTYLRQEDYVRYSQACVTANLCMRRETFLAVGPFDERFDEAACEDWEWSARARRRAIPIVFDRLAIIDHPCMDHWRQLRRKAERLGRGELLLRRMTDRRASPPSLVASWARQVGRFRKLKRLGLGRRLRLFPLQILVAFWMWNGAHRPLSPVARRRRWTREP